MNPFSVSSLLCPLAENFLHYRTTWHLSVFQAWGDLKTYRKQDNSSQRQLAPSNSPHEKLALRQLAPDSEDNSPYFVILKKCILLHLMHKSDTI